MTNDTHDTTPPATDWPALRALCGTDATSAPPPALCTHEECRCPACGQCIASAEHAAALARQLADEQAAHEATRQELAEWQAKAESWHVGFQTESELHDRTRQELAATQQRADFNHTQWQETSTTLAAQYAEVARWQSLADMRQQDYERAAGWARRWKAVAHMFRRDDIDRLDILLTEAMYRGKAERQRDAALALLRRVKAMGGLAPALADELARIEGGGQ